MPKVFSWNCYRFHFFANEGDPREPPHVHVTKDKDTTMFWLRPEVFLTRPRVFASRASQLIGFVEDRRDEIESAWRDFLRPEPLAVRFDADSFWVDLDDGRTLGVPLAWFPRLLHASPEQRAAVSLGDRTALGHDRWGISVAGLPTGQRRPDPAHQSGSMSDWPAAPDETNQIG